MTIRKQTYGTEQSDINGWLEGDGGGGGGERLAALAIRTRISNEPGFSVGRSTNRAIPPLKPAVMLYELGLRLTAKRSWEKLLSSAGGLKCDTVKLYEL